MFGVRIAVNVSLHVVSGIHKNGGKVGNKGKII
jgi:hypothetical protein